MKKFPSKDIAQYAMNWADFCGDGDDCSDSSSDTGKKYDVIHFEKTKHFKLALSNHFLLSFHLALRLV